MRKTNTKRQPPKRRLSSSAAKKLAARRIVYKTTKRTRTFSFRIGRTLTIELRLKLTNKRPVKKRQRLQIRRQVALPLLMIIAGLGGTLYCSRIILAAPTLEPAAFSVESTTEVTKPRKARSINTSLRPSNATRLRIPSVDINAPVDMIGKETNGTLEVPADFNRVGQYRFGPTPGEFGPSIITGHVDHITGPAVFWRLHELKPKQKIYVERQDGTTAVFKVQKVQNFSQNDFPTQEVYGDIKHAGLRLITCGGTFDYLKHRYSHNTVVFAELID